jgi:hypothetical protein
VNVIPHRLSVSSPRRIALWFAAILTAIGMLLAVPSNSRAAEWGPESDLALADLNLYNPTVAISPKGEAVALFSASDGTYTLSIVYWSARSASGTWSTPVALTPSDGYCGSWEISNAQIKLAMAGDGTATAAWICDGTPQNYVQVSTRPAGGVFSTPENLTSETADFSIDSVARGQIDVAASPSGKVTVAYNVVYEAEIPERWEVHAATRPAGSSTFGSPEVIFSGLQDSGGTSLLRNTSIAAGADETFAIGMETRDYDSGNEVVRSAVRPRGQSTFGSSVQLTTPDLDADTDGYKMVAVDNKGRTIMAWMRGPNSPDVAEVAIRSAGASGTFGATQTLTDPSEDMNPGPVTAGPQGTVIYAFLLNQSDDSVVQSTLQPGASSFGSVEELTDGTTDIDEPAVSIGLKGLTTVAWSNNFDPGSENDRIEERTRNAGASLFDPLFDLSGSARDSEDAVVAISPCTGQTVVGWEDSVVGNPPYTVGLRYREGVAFAKGSSAWCPTGKKAAPALDQKGAAGTTSLRVEVACAPGTTGSCRIKLAGRLKGGNGKLVPKTVKVKAGKRKVVTLRYSPVLVAELVAGVSRRIKVSAKQVGAGSRDRVISAPDPVTG